MTCQVLAGAFAYIIQASLGLLAIASLFVKYKWEANQRPIRVWLKDVSKQLVGALSSHLINLYFAVDLSLSQDQCVTYFVSFFTQSILGLVLSYALHRAVLIIARQCHLDAIESGKYENNIDWLAQIVVWTGIIISVNVIVFFGFVEPLKVQLVLAGEWVLQGVVNKPDVELILVMCVVPLVLDVLQFWVQDAFLKFSGSRSTPEIDLV